MKKALWVLMILAMSSACSTPPRATPNFAASPAPDAIGLISAEKSHVEAGASEPLATIDGTKDLLNGFAVRLTQGGIAKLEFLNQISIRLFNDTAIGGVSADVSGTKDGRVRMKLERGGLSGQVVKNGQPFDLEIANGDHIYILGTRFFITFDSTTGITSIGNFDGTIGYYIPGMQNPQFIPAGSLLDIYPNGETKLYTLNFPYETFEDAARQADSPLQALEVLRDKFNAVTVTPTPTITPTSPFPTVCTPPVGWESFIVQPGDTLYSLALRYNISPEILYQQNCLTTPEILPGSILYVPPTPMLTPTVCQPPPAWILYRVQPGDTLFIIGLKYRVTTTELQQGNCMGTSTLIYAGQYLYVPNVATSTPVVRIPTATPFNKSTIFNNPSATFDNITCTITFKVTPFDPEGLVQVGAFFNINGQSPSKVGGGNVQMDNAQGQLPYYQGASTLTNPAQGDIVYYQFYSQDGQGILATSSVFSQTIGTCVQVPAMH